MATYPFHDGDVHATFENVLRNILAEIDGLDNEYVLKASPTELENHSVEKAMIQPLTLHVDQQPAVHRESAHDPLINCLDI